MTPWPEPLSIRFPDAGRRMCGGDLAVGEARGWDMGLFATFLRHPLDTWLTRAVYTLRGAFTPQL